MKKLMQSFFLALSFLSISLYAINLPLKLNKLNKQLDRAELYALNCDMDSQIDKKIHVTCIQANVMLQQANIRLDRIALLNTDNASTVNETIELLKTRASNINQHLTAAKIISGDYNWPNSFIPSIRP